MLRSLCVVKDGVRKRKKQQNKLKWELLFVPTIHKEKALKRPSVLPCASIIRKAPKLDYSKKMN